ncbi:hypothetical protein F443_17753 [Phytophthora nicotianae P1569]|uniref:Ubiquitin-like protease family profile domain-containing protein n=1 Tax=Phytophthora nicotianae P1569 TaxID=1317065 RepID=V9EAP4_PHYNI|nr:hypothetical protein F443_17753 [Phytophthora nicotianae P1569]
MEHLDLAAKGSLGDMTLTAVMQALFAARSDLIYIEPAEHAVMIDGSVSVDVKQLAKVFAHLSNEIVILPINCGGDHCLEQVSDVAKEIVKLLPPSKSPRMRYHIRQFEFDIGIQQDSYNCGVFVLLACEMFCGAACPSTDGALFRSQLHCSHRRAPPKLDAVAGAFCRRAQRLAAHMVNPALNRPNVAPRP